MYQHIVQVGSIVNDIAVRGRCGTKVI